LSLDNSDVIGKRLVALIFHDKPSHKIFIDRRPRGREGERPCDGAINLEEIPTDTSENSSSISTNSANVKDSNVNTTTQQKKHILIEVKTALPEKKKQKKRSSSQSLSYEIQYGNAVDEIIYFLFLWRRNFGRRSKNRKYSLHSLLQDLKYIIVLSSKHLKELGYIPQQTKPVNYFRINSDKIVLDEKGIPFKIKSSKRGAKEKETQPIFISQDISTTCLKTDSSGDVNPTTYPLPLHDEVVYPPKTR
jgi:hypothetical protein